MKKYVKYFISIFLIISLYINVATSTVLAASATVDGTFSSGLLTVAQYLFGLQVSKNMGLDLSTLENQVLYGNQYGMMLKNASEVKADYWVKIDYLGYGIDKSSSSATYVYGYCVGNTLYSYSWYGFPGEAHISKIATNFTINTTVGSVAEYPKSSFIVKDNDDVFTGDILDKFTVKVIDEPVRWGSSKKNDNNKKDKAAYYNQDLVNALIKKNLDDVKGQTVNLTTKKFVTGTYTDSYTTPQTTYLEGEDTSKTKYENYYYNELFKYVLDLNSETEINIDNIANYDDTYKNCTFKLTLKPDTVYYYDDGTTFKLNDLSPGSYLIFVVETGSRLYSNIAYAFNCYLVDPFSNTKYPLRFDMYRNNSLNCSPSLDYVSSWCGWNRDTVPRDTSRTGTFTINSSTGGVLKEDQSEVVLPSEVTEDSSSLGNNTVVTTPSEIDLDCDENMTSDKAQTIFNTTDLAGSGGGNKVTNNTNTTSDDINEDTKQKDDENLDFEPLKVVSLKFPFCIPWDIYYSVKIILSDQASPTITLPDTYFEKFDFTLPGFTWDMAETEEKYPLFKDIHYIFNFFCIVAFVYVLAAKTRDLIRG